MRKISVRFLLLLPLGFFCWISSGCGEDAAERAAKETGEKIDVEVGKGELTVRSKKGTAGFRADDESVVVKTDEGSMHIGRGASLPSNFPKDVPVYDEAIVVQSMVMAETIVATFETGDSFETVVASYEKKCSSNSWTEVGSVTGTSGDPVRVFNYTKGERSLIVSISKDSGEDKTIISLTVSKG